MLKRVKRNLAETSTRVSRGGICRCYNIQELLSFTLSFSLEQLSNGGII